MQTDKIRISSNGEGAAAALEEASKFADYVGLDKKSALRIMLLAEETVGMVNAITEDFRADFWIESNRKKVCRIHLVAKTDMNYLKKRELIEASSTGKNAASRGFMGKVREMIENSLYSVDEIGHMQAEYGGIPVFYGSMGMCDDGGTTAMNANIYRWSLENYRQSIDETKDSNEAVREAWDELEKSIVASIADDVQVAVTKDIVEMIIEKKLA